MEVRVRYIEGKHFDATTRGHRVVTDQPEPSGQDLGMTPPELMLSALGSCAAYYAAEYLRARNLPLEDLEVRVTGSKGGRPTRITEVNIAVETPALASSGIDGSRYAGLQRAVEACLLHQTFLNPPKITMEVETPELAAV
jgi:putative redox protein